MGELNFSHLDPMGNARMVDVTPKDATHRRAVARCKVFMRPETTAAIANREVKKGDVIAVARVAGIQAAKRTSVQERRSGDGHRRPDAVGEVGRAPGHLPAGRY